MNILKIICVLIPLIILSYYVKNIIKPFNWSSFIKLSNVHKSRIYYCISIIWYCIFCIIFYKDIIDINILSKYNNGTTQSVYNYFIITVVFIIIVILINIVVFKNLNITKLNIKGIEINVNEVNALADAAIIRKEKYQILCHVFLKQYEMMSNIGDYINDLTSIEEENLYIDLLSYYEQIRENIKIQCYYYTNDGLLNLKQTNEMSDEEFSTIQYSLDINGVCIPPQDEIKIIYAKIVTAFVFPDIVIRIEGEKLFEQEHLSIQNIVSIFDKELIINSIED